MFAQPAPSNTIPAPACEARSSQRLRTAGSGSTNSSSPKLVKPSSSGRAAFAGGAVTRAKPATARAKAATTSTPPRLTARAANRAARPGSPALVHSCKGMYRCVRLRIDPCCRLPPARRSAYPAWLIRLRATNTIPAAVIASRISGSTSPIPSPSSPPSSESRTEPAPESEPPVPSEPRPPPIAPDLRRVRVGERLRPGAVRAEVVKPLHGRGRDCRRSGIPGSVASPGAPTGSAAAGIVLLVAARSRDRLGILVDLGVGGHRRAGAAARLRRGHRGDGAEHEDYG